jgi:hypothetical protein
MEREKKEREFEIGMDEAWKVNMKNLFDAWLQEYLEGSRFQRSHIARILSDAQQNDQVRQNIANQALQNAVETANMVSKQAIRHTDIAVDCQWNPDPGENKMNQTKK